MALPAGAWDIRYSPVYPSIDQEIQIEIRGATQGAMLHWGVNAVGMIWDQAIPEYRPPGSILEGVATRTPMQGPDERGVLRLTLGPFNNTNQLIRSLNFAIHWNDGTWANKDEKNYNIPVSFGRIGASPEEPTINDRVVVRVRRSRPGGLLRWGVNAENQLWKPPRKEYWPPGTFATPDGLAVDTPLGKPDSNGVSTVALGPFNRADQVVRTLHMAVHWGDDWDTDAGRNYNVGISLETGPEAPSVRLLSPQDGEVIVDNPQVQLQAEGADRAEMWLDGRSIASVGETPFELKIPFRQLKYGRHQLTARAEREGLVGLQEIFFWKLPPHRVENLPQGVPWGATVNPDGTATFTLHAPGKKFISLVGDFNGWDPFADMMTASPDGTWWTTRPVSNGAPRYQFCIEGRQFLADPYARDIEWKDEAGREGHQPWHARAVLEVGQPPFAWTATNYTRPPLDQLAIYEFHIDDLAPGGGFTGVIARLDYIRDLGFNAIEPMPWMEFTVDRSWGYNPAFHFAPESAYGTPGELKRLIDEAHRRGLAVIMDAVFNHMDRNSALYQLYGADYEASPYFRLFRGENWGFPDLDQQSRAFKRYVEDAIRCWLTEYRVDGIRFDATRFVEWEGYNDWGAGWLAWAGRQADAGSYMIAEHIPSDPELIRRTEMDATWGDSFRWVVRGYVEEGRLDRDEFARLLDPAQLGFGGVSERIAYTESHDEERVMRDLRRRGYSRDEAERRALLALALTLTAPGPAMVYAGQEFGEDTAKTVGSNPLNWGRTEGWFGRPARRLRDAARALVRLRTTHPALRTGAVTLDQQGLPDGVAVYTRGEAGAAVVVAANFGRRERRVTVNLPGAGPWRDVLRGNPASPLRGDRITIALEPGGVAVWATDLSLASVR
ncbi:MAG TPA: alpha-amylase family glycosyl hydrolase [Kiritimatiellia bacterium]|nr:alpha-amylase family glycosyl hydrolase [Kiritimatiellia bacterium]